MQLCTCTVRESTYESIFEDYWYFRTFVLSYKVRKYFQNSTFVHTKKVLIRKYFRTKVLSYESTKVLSKVRKYEGTDLATRRLASQGYVRNALVYLHVRCTVPSKVLSYFRTRKYESTFESTFESTKVRRQALPLPTYLRRFILLFMIQINMILYQMCRIITYFRTSVRYNECTFESTTYITCTFVAFVRKYFRTFVRR